MTAEATSSLAKVIARMTSTPLRKQVVVFAALLRYPETRIGVEAQAFAVLVLTGVASPLGNELTHPSTKESP